MDEHTDDILMGTALVLGYTMLGPLTREVEEWMGDLADEFVRWTCIITLVYGGTRNLTAGIIVAAIYEVFHKYKEYKQAKTLKSETEH